MKTIEVQLNCDTCGTGYTAQVKVKNRCSKECVKESLKQGRKLYWEKRRLEKGQTVNVEDTIGTSDNGASQPTNMDNENQPETTQPSEGSPEQNPDSVGQPAPEQNPVDTPSEPSENPGGVEGQA